ncbi:MAG: HAMP domain-containing histidine kinase [Halobacteriovoraceae bacterium]|nr:HAMP domain-containing histidine kinase [Halobacteriovoraceae bacterium]MCB9095369.1 HAMP domain-containing histidine kinase [Halobacteriovoraceae bacterium]
MQEATKKSFNEIKDLYNFVSEKCSHIANIISSQQRYANLKETIRVKTDLKEVTSDCYSMISDNINKRGINFIISDFETPLIMAEKVGLSQVILNILVNAIESIDQKLKYTVAQNEKIEVCFEENADNVLMHIKDTGMGADHETLKNLFNFGFSTKKRSSGFGLHNCSNFMAKNGGEIQITSEGKFKGALVSLSFEKAS